jgi:hypothetical protein
MDRLALVIVKKVLENLSDRRGLRQALEEIDDEVRRQMEGELQALVLKLLNRYNATTP